MADRAEMFSLATFHALSPPGCRPPQDISLEEFDDEDLSEITDDCGIGLNYDSDHYEKDSRVMEPCPQPLCAPQDGLVLERCEQPHPICTFSEDFQEFEMIDDNEDEEEPDGTGLDVPPSPSASPIPSPSTEETQKPRPSTLSLSVPGAQDSLNNNGSYPPPSLAQRATWQESLLHSPSSSSSSHTGHLSPSHPCVQDGPCLDSQNGLRLTPEETGQAQTQLKPSFYDLEGNRHGSRAYGNQPPERAGEDYNMNIISSAPCSPHSPSHLRQSSPKQSLSPTGPAAPPNIATHSEASKEPQTCEANSRQPKATESDCAKLKPEAASDRKGQKPSKKGPPADGTGGGAGLALSHGSPIALLGQSSTPLSEEELPKGYGDSEVGVFSDRSDGEVGCTPGAYVCLRELTEQLSSEGEGPHCSRAASMRGLPSGSSETTSPSSDPGIEADLTSRNSKQFLPRSRHSDDLSSPGSDSDVEGEIEAAFACGGRLVSNMISSISETELDLSSDSSSGRSSHLTNSIEEASSPTSEAELETELEGQGLMGIKDSLLLDKCKEEEEVTLEGELPESHLRDRNMVRRESLADLKMEGYYDTLNPEDSCAPIDQTDVSGSSPLDLKIDPDHSLESIRRSFYLPIGPKLLPEVDDEGNSEYDSDSESEPDLSEDSDSPWLLSNLVNKMILEGSYPLKCPDECFQQAHSLCDTISPASDLEPEILSESLDVQPSLRDSPGSEAEPAKLSCSQQSIELVDMETLRSSLQSAEDEKPTSTSPATESSPPGSDSGPYLFMSNPTNDTITPVFLGHPLSIDRLGSSRVLANFGCCTGPIKSFSFTSPASTEGSDPASREQGPQVEPAAGPEDWAIDKDLDSGILEDNGMIDDIRLENLGRNPDAFLPLLDVSTAKTNRCFNLTYSTDEDDVPYFGSLKGSPFHDDLESFEEDLPLPPPPVAQEPRPLDESLVYDSIKYTLVVDENTQLELVSLKRCTSVLSDDSELLRACDNCDLEDEDEFGEGLTAQDGQSSSEDSSPEADLQFSKKFLNVFVNSTSRSSSTESFGLFSCMVNGEEREQTHRAVFRFIPRHEDELELDVDDPILVELEEDDYWYRGYNMRTGERGIFPAFYAHEVVSQAKEVIGLKRNPSWVERFSVQFLGSVEVPYHQGNGILCAAMQKIATTRKLTVHLRPPATCDLRITLQGIKLILTVNEHSRDEESERCSHFFQMKNISFCGCHPRNSCYFGFITKHPVLSRFACHVFVSQESMRHVAECVGRAFQEYYQEHLEYACPTEDIYLE
ncbi:C-Jun-amino-terminal kinase-interacting protein 2 isoform X3 [Gopherus flavomarginatus]|uniref:C-Jun-amino-terminal kinase-interacting protein 2 isoform X1 n=2 Tax=Gopherus flavomarginatus TaxID=286002 RepID=UPI0021CBAA08|nr:C-Jun-amino-terminal kinase-interacting protein 2 isoform X1 [Gopherus flavomarginatus]XP_050808588.1 C-Jun-amino-terminal kinase-interacting protein 2 isoform X2 [Gopherus flavomarginatus]XP_050808598.1 C-Jun-amino-terminal kinase-interacting protein 2 isoform X3 [Gopherus flavomarginatus]